VAELFGLLRPGTDLEAAHWRDMHAEGPEHLGLGGP
jgi:hypothetical protein